VQGGFVVHPGTRSGPSKFIRADTARASAFPTKPKPMMPASVNRVLAYEDARFSALTISMASTSCGQLVRS